LEALGVDYIDESEVLTPADHVNHVHKHTFKTPFVCGCRNLGEALRRIAEGAAMSKTSIPEVTGGIVKANRIVQSVPRVRPVPVMLLRPSVISAPSTRRSARPQPWTSQSFTSMLRRSVLHSSS
jgi:hypothetical protein